MKKQLLLTIAMLLAVVSGYAQKTWDFTVTPAADSTALAAATSEWSVSKTGEINRFQSKNAIDGAIKAGGQELLMTKGLKVNAAKEKLRIDVNARMQFAGKNVTLTIPQLKKGQVVTVVMASTGSTAVTLDLLTNLSGTTGFTAADKNTVQTATGTVTANGDVTLACSVGSINIFSVSVSADPQADFNKAIVTLNDNTQKIYNTAEIAAIDIDEKGNVTVGSDVYNGNVQKIVFQKKIATPDPGTEPGTEPGTDPGTEPGTDPTPDPTPQPGEIVNGDVTITDSKGWLESVYAKWNLMEGAKTYNVYVKGGQYSDFTKIDEQLVRNYGSYGRADVVGLKAGTYELKVIPVDSNGNELTAKGSSVSQLEVKSHNRYGFAHFKHDGGVGAYNNDGTLKQGAKVIYVTKNNFNTVSAELITDAKKGKTETFTGLGKILEGKKKGQDPTPIAVRIIGEIKKSDVNVKEQFMSDQEGLQLKADKETYAMDVTIEGIGDDATMNGFGMTFYNGTSMEMRNLAIINYKEDGIQIKSSQHVWVHNIDIFYGSPGGDADQAKGDGALDIKDDARYCTFAYNHFWDSGKSSLCGMKSESGPNYMSYHHNWFDHSDSRHPRVRTMTVHVWNNYFDGVAKIGVGAVKGANIFVESNYFRNSKNPMLISEQGTDGRNGFAEDHDGGMIKAYGNVLTGKSLTTFIPHTKNATEFDAYVATTRDEQVPTTYKSAVGNYTYNNFDTDASLMYSYQPDAAEDVPGIVMGWFGAGRLAHGDLQWTFSESDDAKDAVDTGLKAKVTGYKTTLVGIFGDENADSGEQPGGDDEPGGDQPGGSDQPGGGDEPTPITGATLYSFDGSPSDAMFTVNGYGDGNITYNGVAYKKGIKLNSTGYIKFKAPSDCYMTVVLSTAKDARDFKLNNEQTTVGGTENKEGKYYQMERIALTGGTEYTLTKGSKEGMVMLIILEPKE